VNVAAEFTPHTLRKTSQGEKVRVKLTLPCRLTVRDLDVASVRLNGQVPVKRVSSITGRLVQLEFDRAAVIAVLPTGNHVEIRVTGTLKGMPFLGRDVIKVTP
jgi:hypothetical protein